jgi:hypothetical protein
MLNQNSPVIIKFEREEKKNIFILFIRTELTNKLTSVKLQMTNYFIIVSNR